jgi:acetyl esterase/lipase
VNLRAHHLLKYQTALNAANLQINCAKGFIVGGISAGANLAAVSSHLYCDEMPGPPLTGVYLSIPTLLDPPSVAAKYKDVYLSREQNKNALILNDSSMALFDRGWSSHSLLSLVLT